MNRLQAVEQLRDAPSLFKALALRLAQSRKSCLTKFRKGLKGTLANRELVVTQFPYPQGHARIERGIWVRTGNKYRHDSKIGFFSNFAFATRKTGITHQMNLPITRNGGLCVERMGLARAGE